MFARLHVNAGVNPGVITGKLDFLGEALFAGRRFGGSGILRVWLLGRRYVVSNELSAKSMRSGCCAQQYSNENRCSFKETLKHR
jgi:hypothetical protein